MNDTFSTVAKEVVKQMLPNNGVVGCDVESPAYEDIVNEVAASNGTTDRETIDNEVTALLQYIGEHGFSILS